MKKSELLKRIESLEHEVHTLRTELELIKAREYIWLEKTAPAGKPVRLEWWETLPVYADTQEPIA